MYINLESRLQWQLVTDGRYKPRQRRDSGAAGRWLKSIRHHSSHNHNPTATWLSIHTSRRLFFRSARMLSVNLSWPRPSHEVLRDVAPQYLARSLSASCDKQNCFFCLSRILHSIIRLFILTAWSSGDSQRDRESTEASESSILCLNGKRCYTRGHALISLMG